MPTQSCLSGPRLKESARHSSTPTTRDGRKPLTNSELKGNLKGGKSLFKGRPITPTLASTA